MIGALITHLDSSQTTRPVPDFKPGGWHDLRHTYISELAAIGLPPNDLKRIAGHEKVEITLGYYVHATPDANARVLGALLRSNKDVANKVEAPGDIPRDITGSLHATRTKNPPAE